MCVSFQTERCARMPDSSQMVGAGVAHLAYCDRFCQEALNWIGNQPEDVNFKQNTLKRNKANVAE